MLADILPTLWELVAMTVLSLTALCATVQQNVLFVIQVISLAVEQFVFLVELPTVLLV